MFNQEYLFDSRIEYIYTYFFLELSEFSSSCLYFDAVNTEKGKNPSAYCNKQQDEELI